MINFKTCTLGQSLSQFLLKLKANNKLIIINIFIMEYLNFRYNQTEMNKCFRFKLKKLFKFDQLLFKIESFF